MPLVRQQPSNPCTIGLRLQEMINKMNYSVKKRMKAGYGKKKNKSRTNTLEIESLRSMCGGVSRKDRCRNSYVRERCGLKEDVVTKVERMLKIRMIFGIRSAHGEAKVGPPYLKAALTRRAALIAHLPATRR
ncbi:hypothetical protein EVAR_77208_1 [Eumeta japonica]|uniref:Uncharacterized protein n=1 Tax=Eumeta variegata TaxID=151549 RepID=A0A4C1T316_EUMVA|nr:hypothetical protein EVAR_77208_1 [Eumeta japonica]